MNSDHGGLLKTRAESFARHLQTRLKRLSESEDSSWTEAPNSEVYYDIDSSLTSPQEEVGEPIFIAAQNRDDLRLQRSDSEASNYFDTVEEFEDLTSHSSVSLKNKPIDVLNLNDEFPTVTQNGDSSCSDDTDNISRRESCSSQMPMDNEILNSHYECLGSLENNGALEMSILRLELDRVEKETDVSCDILNKVEERNNNNKNGIEDISEYKINLENNTNLNLIEVDTGQLNKEDLAEHIKKIESVDSLSCVLCDIEEMKSKNVFNGWTEHKILDIENENNSNIILKTKNIEVLTSNPSQDEDSCKEISLASDNVDIRQKLGTDNDNNSKHSSSLTHSQKSKNDDSSYTDDKTPITVLLKAMKDEMKTKTDSSTEFLGMESTTSNDSQSDCPNIEIRGPSPSIDEKSCKNSEEEFDIETRRKHFRRSSSLKSGKTPPGTPGRKKIVRFADVLGLDLADVKTFLDEVPTVPMSAFQDLHGVDLSQSSAEELLSNKFTVVIPQIEKIVVPLFQQPCVQPNFLDRVRENNVCLENAVVSDMSLFAISGLVRVKNIDFHKSVYVRYSINNWQSFSDLQARYVPSSCDGFSDKFSFVLYAHTLTVGQKLEFAIRFHAFGQQFWDSNGGLNYAFLCSPTEPSRTFITSPVILPSNSDETAAFY